VASLRGEDGPGGGLNGERGKRRRRTRQSSGRARTKERISTYDVIGLGDEGSSSEVG
jgi:hypothetical protein